MRLAMFQLTELVIGLRRLFFRSWFLEYFSATQEGTAARILASASDTAAVVLRLNVIMSDIPKLQF